MTKASPNIRLSIIIPFYNVERYIAQCLDSVYDQDIPENEYEVICVNDASPDNSREIVKEYQKKHANLILVEHEKNKKLGAARNTGRSIARGKYIWNVDSDDMIVPNCLRGILQKCEENDLDVLLFRNKLLKEQKYIEPKYIWDANEEVTDGFTFWKQQGTRNRSTISAVWKMVLCREYLDRNAIYSPEINMNEDAPYTYKCLLLSRRMIASNEINYITRVNAESLTSEFKRHTSLDRLYEDMCISTKDLYALYKQIPSKEEAIRKAVRDLIQYEFLDDVRHLSHFNAEQKHMYGRLLRRNICYIAFLLCVLSRPQCIQFLKLLVA